MAQFHSFDEKLFREAIRNKADQKNFIRLKVSVISAIQNDPTFASGEAENALDILRRECPEIFERKKDLGYEEKRTDSDTWDSDYFMRNTTYLEQNFCEDRINELKNIGQEVYGKKQTRQTETMKQNSNRPKPAYSVQPSVRQNATVPADKEGKQGKNPPITAPERRYRLLAVAIAVVVVLVLITGLTLNPVQ